MPCTWSRRARRAVALGQSSRLGLAEVGHSGPLTPSWAHCPASRCCLDAASQHSRCGCHHITALLLLPSRSPVLTPLPIASPSMCFCPLLSRAVALPLTVLRPFMPCYPTVCVRMFWFWLLSTCRPCSIDRTPPRRGWTKPDLPLPPPWLFLPCRHGR